MFLINLCCIQSLYINATKKHGNLHLLKKKKKLSIRCHHTPYMKSFQFFIGYIGILFILLIYILTA